MMMFGSIGFAVPWLLVALIVLPILWIILRAMPPAPVLRRFPGVALLLGLQDDESQTATTPWWLLALRTLAVAAAIIGFAGPVLNPEQRETGRGPLLIVLDGTWADARDWTTRMDHLETVLTDAQRAQRPVAIEVLSDVSTAPVFVSASEWQTRQTGLRPNAWGVSNDVVEWAQMLEGSFDTYWMSSGVAFDEQAELTEAFQSYGELVVFDSGSPLYGLRPAEIDGGRLTLRAQRLHPVDGATIQVAGYGADPSGVERALVSANVDFADGESAGEVSIFVQPELRNRITRFAIVGETSAASVSLSDDALKRREVALIAGQSAREGLELLSPLHYLRQALEPTVDLLEVDFDDMILANPDAIVMADVARIFDDEAVQLIDWVEKGGILVRFAGPRLAASDEGRAGEHPLMPVRLRQGGRSIGGAMSWGAPKSLRMFPENSPFFGLSVAQDVTVSSQVMAQPDPNLSERVIASLDDGTPLVTRKIVGDGAVILFHVTANAEWSTLPLSGLFVQMLDRLAISSGSVDVTAEDMIGTTWIPVRVIDAFGRLQTDVDNIGIDGTLLADGVPSSELVPAVYQNGERQVAVNVISEDFDLRPAVWPANIRLVGPTAPAERDLKGLLLLAALMLLAIDAIASLWIGGRLARGVVAAFAVGLVLSQMPTEATAQSGADQFALNAANELVLGYVVTGDTELDEISQAGLLGLSQTLRLRTSIEPSNPVGVNLENDELAFFPFLYWPVSPEQSIPSSAAYAKLNRYLRSGGMIMFDTRDGHVSGFGGGSSAAKKLQSLAAPLDIPPLEPVPEDHVLTRAFYLLQDFPGRHVGADVWVEAAPEGADQIEGIPFRNLNDGVTPIVIGGNDWAGAWAVLPNGQRMFPVGRGYAGERQREFARRFGVNLIMHVLTGNYKSDQIHVPALLERLGQ